MILSRDVETREIVEPKVGMEVIWRYDDNRPRRVWKIYLIEGEDILLEWLHDRAVKVDEILEVVCSK